ncbi:hypothetical protein LTR64_003005 [Lithohypha guttulata]|uniref:uncharacterized protein n=1 Tax=Lithohypha guttulata TaxID=1690604 RepID=UPI002DDEEE17|nr:hypothetical protein LTR51_000771 [Lithohypha guttulata]
MSYPSLSNYYGSSAQPPNTDSNAYTSNRSSGAYNYPSSITGSTSGQQVSYGSSGYGYTGQSLYPNNTNIEQDTEGYANSANYNYRRNNQYDHQDSSLNDAYPQNYYGQSNPNNSQHPTQSHAEGLSNLAYASGLDPSTTRSTTSRDTQHHSAVPQHDRTQSPVEMPSRYSVNPPTVSTSYPMQQQASASSSSSQQLAHNAAAALAGAVGRRYPNQQQGKTASPSPNVPNARPSVTQRTASPQVYVTSTSYSAYSQQPSTVANISHSYVTNQQPRSTRGNQPGSNPPASARQTHMLNGTTTVQKSNVSSNQANQQQQSTSTKRRNIQQMGSIANLVTAAHEAESGGYAQAPATPDSAPNFIDPTAVFDPYHRERERRRQEAAAGARRKAEEQNQAEVARTQGEAELEQQMPQGDQQKAVNVQKRQAAKETSTSSGKKSEKRKADETTASTSTVAEPASTVVGTEEEAMALEMKSIMEKMKSFQSKDPSLFKKLWNDMRQPGSQAPSNVVQSPSPQIIYQPLPGPTASSDIAANQQTPNRPISTQVSESVERPLNGKRKAAKVGPDGSKLYLNGYSVVVENNAEGLPDLGRFPAERRIRSAKYNRKEKADDDQEVTTEEQLAGSTLSQSENPPPLPAVTASARSFNKKSASAAKAQATPSALQNALGSAASGSTVIDGSGTAKSSSGTVWPLEKRNALTMTAMRVLKANPENANIELAEDDLRKMLENNPSYITLCELLEQRGLKFHRGHFARELLNSVPELKTPTPVANIPPTPTQQLQVAVTTSAEASTPAQPAPTPSQPPYPVPPPGYMIQWHNSPTGQFVPPPPNAQYGQGVLHSSGYGHRPPSSLKTPKSKLPKRPEPVPGSKEAAARKRDFSELVDLTQLTEDENYVVPDKLPQSDDIDSDVEMKGDTFQVFRHQSQAPAGPNQVQTHPGYYPAPEQPVQFNPQYPQVQLQPRKVDNVQDSRNQRTILAKPLHKSEALRKQYYDPKTVARDVLIASGRHPSERPLNVHLAGMLGKHIDLESDVSTFEWDEIDPGGPSVSKVELVDLPATKPRFKLGDRTVRKAKMPVDRTRHPEKEKRPPNALASPSQPQAPSANTQFPKFPKLKNPSGLRHSLLASDAHATPATFDPTRPSHVLPIEPASSAQNGSPEGNVPVVKRRMGRPPGSKNKYPSLKALKEQAAATSATVTINVPQREPTPSRDKFKCKWKKCPTVLHNLDVLRKHIGRVHRPSNDDAANEGYTCWWKKCKFLKQDENGDWITTKAFEHWEEWLKHIERDHITPIAMKYGDGPATAHVDPLIIQRDREAYCADGRHHEVTPMINDKDNGNEHYPRDVLNLTEVTPHDIPKKSLTHEQKTERAAFDAFLRAHGLSADTKAASKEVLRAFEKRKEKMGPGLDRGGCTLVTQEMRETFVQNPGVRQVVAWDA